jgi:ribosomal protein L37AE/L43A
MPKVENDVPERLKPYIFHGVNLTWTDKVATGDCPWCGREGKFSADVETGMWKCFVCGEGSDKGGGNVYTFLQLLWKMADKDTTDYSELAADRKLLPDTLVQWELVVSPLTGDWLIPGYNAKRKLCQLYRRVVGEQRSLLMPTSGLSHQLFGVPLLNNDNSTIYVCEGLWDGMALWEAMGQCKYSGDEGLSATSNPSYSLLSESSVLAAPSCSAFSESWLPLFKDKTVVLMYDNDHPRTNPKTGKVIAPAGWAGMRRAAGILAGTAKEIRILRWGGSESYSPNLAPGYDLRDALTTGPDSLPDRLAQLLATLGPLPDEWRIKPKPRHAAHPKSEGMECTPCKSYKKLTTAWRKALLWNDGLDRALACMLASIASTQMLGDQLWLKVLGPAACGKSTLCEAISVNKDYVLAKSTIRGFHSGFKEQGGGKEEDNSLLSLLPGKTLVTKDGDTLLQSPNLPQILSEGRDVYDGVSRTHYRNTMSKDYDGLRITWILCGTSSLRQIDSSELGERFLDCVIMEGIDDDMEDEILERVVHRAARDVALESDGEASKHYPPEMASAMQLTGGYVTWLRENAVEKLAVIDYPSTVRRQLTRFGKFAAHMRARPSLRQEEVAEREFATRLVSQLTRLAGCLALVLNKSSVDGEVMRRVRQVVMDTSRGRTLSITTYLYQADKEIGLESKTLSVLVGQTEDKIRSLLRFLRAIHVVELHYPINEKGVKGRMHWRLTNRMHRLYTDAHRIFIDE